MSLNILAENELDDDLKEDPFIFEIVLCFCYHLLETACPSTNFNEHHILMAQQMGLLSWSIPCCPTYDHVK